MYQPTDSAVTIYYKKLLTILLTYYMLIIVLNICKGFKMQKNTINNLQNMLKSYNETQIFKPGDIVYWKKDLKNKNRPKYNKPMIVIEILRQPILSPITDDGSPYFRETLDILCGLIDTDNDFIMYYYDSKRLVKK